MENAEEEALHEEATGEPEYNTYQLVWIQPDGTGVRQTVFEKSYSGAPSVYASRRQGYKHLRDGSTWSGDSYLEPSSVDDIQTAIPGDDSDKEQRRHLKRQYSETCNSCGALYIDTSMSIDSESDASDSDSTHGRSVIIRQFSADSRADAMTIVEPSPQNRSKLFRGKSLSRSASEDWVLQHVPHIAGTHITQRHGGIGGQSNTEDIEHGPIPLNKETWTKTRFSKGTAEVTLSMDRGIDKTLQSENVYIPHGTCVINKSSVIDGELPGKTSFSKEGLVDGPEQVTTRHQQDIPDWDPVHGQHILRKPLLRHRSLEKQIPYKIFRTGSFHVADGEPVESHVYSADNVTRDGGDIQDGGDMTLNGTKPLPHETQDRSDGIIPGRDGIIQEESVLAFSPERKAPNTISEKLLESSVGSPVRDYNNARFLKGSTPNTNQTSPYRKTLDSGTKHIEIRTSGDVDGRYRPGEVSETIIKDPRPSHDAVSGHRQLPGEFSEAIIKDPRPSHDAVSGYRQLPGEFSEAIINDPRPSHDAVSVYRQLPAEVSEAIIKHPRPSHDAVSGYRQLPAEVSEATIKHPRPSHDAVSGYRQLPAEVSEATIKDPRPSHDAVSGYRQLPGEFSEAIINDPRPSHDAVSGYRQLPAEVSEATIKHPRPSHDVMSGYRQLPRDTNVSVQQQGPEKLSTQIVKQLSRQTDQAYRFNIPSVALPSGHTYLQANKKHEDDQRDTVVLDTNGLMYRPSIERSPGTDNQPDEIHLTTSRNPSTMPVQGLSDQPDQPVTDNRPTHDSQNECAYIQVAEQATLDPVKEEQPEQLAIKGYKYMHGPNLEPRQNQYQQQRIEELKVSKNIDDSKTPEVNADNQQNIQDQTDAVTFANASGDLVTNQSDQRPEDQFQGETHSIFHPGRQEQLNKVMEIQGPDNPQWVFNRPDGDIIAEYKQLPGNCKVSVIQADKGQRLGRSASLHRHQIQGQRRAPFREDGLVPKGKDSPASFVPVISAFEDNNPRTFSKEDDRGLNQQLYTGEGNCTSTDVTYKSILSDVSHRHIPTTKKYPVISSTIAPSTNNSISPAGEQVYIEDTPLATRQQQYRSHPNTIINNDLRTNETYSPLSEGIIQPAKLNRYQEISFGRLPSDLPASFTEMSLFFIDHKETFINNSQRAFINGGRNNFGAIPIIVIDEAINNPGKFVAQSVPVEEESVKRESKQSLHSPLNVVDTHFNTDNKDNDSHSSEWSSKTTSVPAVDCTETQECKDGGGPIPDESSLQSPRIGRANAPPNAQIVDEDAQSSEWSSKTASVPAVDHREPQGHNDGGVSIYDELSLQTSPTCRINTPPYAQVVHEDVQSSEWCNTRASAPPHVHSEHTDNPAMPVYEETSLQIQTHRNTDGVDTSLPVSEWSSPTTSDQPTAHLMSQHDDGGMPIYAETSLQVKIRSNTDGVDTSLPSSDWSSKTSVAPSARHVHSQILGDGGLPVYGEPSLSISRPNDDVRKTSPSSELPNRRLSGSSPGTMMSPYMSEWSRPTTNDQPAAHLKSQHDEDGGMLIYAETSLFSIDHKETFLNNGQRAFISGGRNNFGAIPIIVVDESINDPDRSVAQSVPVEEESVKQESKQSLHSPLNVVDTHVDTDNKDNDSHSREWSSRPATSVPVVDSTETQESKDGGVPIQDELSLQSPLIGKANAPPNAQIIDEDAHSSEWSSKTASVPAVDSTKPGVGKGGGVSLYDELSVERPQTCRTNTPPYAQVVDEDVQGSEWCNTRASAPPHVYSEHTDDPAMPVCEETSLQIQTPLTCRTNTPPYAQVVDEDVQSSEWCNTRASAPPHVYSEHTYDPAVPVYEETSLQIQTHRNTDGVDTGLPVSEWSSPTTSDQPTAHLKSQHDDDGGMPIYAETSLQVKTRSNTDGVDTSLPSSDWSSKTSVAPSARHVHSQILGDGGLPVYGEPSLSISRPNDDVRKTSPSSELPNRRLSGSSPGTMMSPYMSEWSRPTTNDQPAAHLKSQHDEDGGMLIYAETSLFSINHKETFLNNGQRAFISGGRNNFGAIPIIVVDESINDPDRSVAQSVPVEEESVKQESKQSLHSPLNVVDTHVDTDNKDNDSHSREWSSRPATSVPVVDSTETQESKDGGVPIQDELSLQSPLIGKANAPPNAQIIDEDAHSSEWSSKTASVPAVDSTKPGVGKGGGVSLYDELSVERPQTCRTNTPPYAQIVDEDVQGSEWCNTRASAPPHVYSEHTDDPAMPVCEETSLQIQTPLTCRTNTPPYAQVVDEDVQSSEWSNTRASAPPHVYSEHTYDPAMPVCEETSPQIQTHRNTDGVDTSLPVSEWSSPTTSDQPTAYLKSQHDDDGGMPIYAETSLQVKTRSNTDGVDTSLPSSDWSSKTSVAPSARHVHSQPLGDGGLPVYGEPSLSISRPNDDVRKTSPSSELSNRRASEPCPGTMMSPYYGAYRLWPNDGPEQRHVLFGSPSDRARGNTPDMITPVHSRVLHSRRPYYWHRMPVDTRQGDGSLPCHVCQSLLPLLDRINSQLRELESQEPTPHEEEGLRNDMDRVFESLYAAIDQREEQLLASVDDNSPHSGKGDVDLGSLLAHLENTKSYCDKTLVYTTKPELLSLTGMIHSRADELLSQEIADPAPPSNVMFRDDGLTDLIEEIERFGKVFNEKDVDAAVKENTFPKEHELSENDMILEQRRLSLQSMPPVRRASMPPDNAGRDYNSMPHSAMSDRNTQPGPVPRRGSRDAGYNGYPDRNGSGGFPPHDPYSRDGLSGPDRSQEAYPYQQNDLSPDDRRQRSNAHDPRAGDTSPIYQPPADRRYEPAENKYDPRARHADPLYRTPDDGRYEARGNSHDPHDPQNRHADPLYRTPGDGRFDARGNSHDPHDPQGRRTDPLYRTPDDGRYDARGNAHDPQSRPAGPLYRAPDDGRYDARGNSHDPHDPQSRYADPLYRTPDDGRYDARGNQHDPQNRHADALYKTPDEGRYDPKGNQLDTKNRDTGNDSSGTHPQGQTPHSGYANEGDQPLGRPLSGDEIIPDQASQQRSAPNQYGAAPQQDRTAEQPAPNEADTFPGSSALAVYLHAHQQKLRENDDGPATKDTMIFSITPEPDSDRDAILSVSPGLFRHEYLIKCVHMEFDKGTVYEDNHVTQDGKLVNDPPYLPSPSTSWRFKNYKGALSTRPLDGTGMSYLEFWTDIEIKQVHGGRSLIFEAAVADRDVIDLHHKAEDQIHAWGVSLSKCPDHDGLCRRTWGAGQEQTHYPHTLPNQPGSEARLRFGFLIMQKQKKLVVIDCHEEKVLLIADNIKISRPLWPVFGVYNTDLSHVETSFVSGTNLKMDRNIAWLILQNM